MLGFFGLKKKLPSLYLRTESLPSQEVLEPLTFKKKCFKCMLKKQTKQKKENL
jgi:hypothetical protein